MPSRTRSSFRLFLCRLLMSRNYPENIWWLITCRKDSVWRRGLSGWQIVGYNGNGPSPDLFHPHPRKTDRTPRPIPLLFANLHPIPANVLMICYIKAYRWGYCRIVERFAGFNAVRISIRDGKKKNWTDGNIGLVMVIENFQSESFALR